MNYKIYQQYRSYAQQSYTRLSELRGKFSGAQIYIVGTGPSIKETDLHRLQGKVVIFMNNALELSSEIKAKTQFSILTDHLRAIEMRRMVTDLKVTCITSSDKIFNPTVDPKIFASPYLFAMPKLTDKRDGGLQVSPAYGFSSDIRRGIYLGKSVVFPSIQLAHHLGASCISLVGVDMTIGKQAAYYNSAIKSNWSAFDYTRDGRPHFEIMHTCLSERGVQLENLTVGGDLDILPHAPTALALSSSGHTR